MREKKANKKICDHIKKMKKRKMKIQRIEEELKKIEDHLDAYSSYLSNDFSYK